MTSWPDPPPLFDLDDERFGGDPGVAPAAEAKDATTTSPGSDASTAIAVDPPSAPAAASADEHAAMPDLRITPEAAGRAAVLDDGADAARWREPVGVFDLETTGVDVTADRIVTAYVGLLDSDGSVLRQRSWLADPGIEIPAGATAVHGITTEHARANGRPAAEVVAEIVAELQGIFCDGFPVVAYNAPFDFSVLKNESVRHGVEPISSPAPVIDPLVVDKRCDRYRRGKRTLDVVAAHYSVPLEDAHDASADAVAAGRVALAIAERYAEALPATPQELHTQQVGWARAQAESLTDYFIRIGRIDPDDRLDGSWPIR